MNKQIKKCFILLLLLMSICIILISNKKVAKAANESSEYQMSEDEEYLIQKIAVAEAENQGIGGMCFVMQTVLNRIMSEDFPNDVESVIKEKNQFTSISSGRYDKVEPNDNSLKALKLIKSGMLKNKGQLYFESVESENDWQSKNREYLFDHLNHRFYK